MNYLLVNTPNGWQQVDIDSDSIAITIQANDIAELKSREASRSNRIKLPRTNKNLAIFDTANLPNTKTVIPYRYFDCLLYENGVEIFGSTARLKLMNISDQAIEVCIYATIFDFFSKIKELNIKDLNINEVNNLWSGVTVAERLLAGNLIFPLADWASENNSSAFSIWENPNNGQRYLNIKAKYIVPAYKFSAIIEQIFIDQGYNLDLPISVLNDQKYTKSYVPLSDITPTDAYKIEIDTAFLENPNVQTFSSGGPGGRYLSFPIMMGNFGTQSGDQTRPRFRPRASGTYSFRITVSLSGQMFCFFSARFEGIDSSYVSMQGPFNGTYELYLVAELSIDSDYYFRFSFVNMDHSITFYNVNVECIKVDYSGAIFPCYLDVAKSLPSLTQSDILMFLAQMYGLIINVNERTKTVSFISYDDIINNVRSGNIKDWSDKLDISEESVDFIISSYGQKNIIKYESMTGADNNTIDDEDYIYIDNTTLEEKKDLFTLAAKAVEETNISGYTMAKIRVMQEGSLSSLNDTDFRLLFCDLHSGSFRFIYTFSDTEYPLYNTQAVISSFNQLSMKNIIGNYKTLQDNFLKDARLMKLSFKLSPIDIQNFDHSIPIYLSKYGCCFYVNKISNYVRNKTTTVELIAIKGVS